MRRKMHDLTSVSISIHLIFGDVNERFEYFFYFFCRCRVYHQLKLSSVNHVKNVKALNEITGMAKKQKELISIKKEANFITCGVDHVKI